MSYRIEHVRKKYSSGFLLSLDGVEIPEGKITCIIGPSGGGKSTLLRILGGLDTEGEWQLELFGEKKSQLKDFTIRNRQEISFMAQKPVSLRRSVRDNIRYPLDLANVPREKADARVLEIAKTTGLIERLSSHSARISGGEAQRMSMARAMITSPKLLLLDEPTANLDPTNVGILETLIKNLNDEEGTTVVLVTHNMFQARRLAQHMLLLINGELVAAGDPVEFFDEAGSELVRAFVRGEMVY